MKRPQDLVVIETPSGSCRVYQGIELVQTFDEVANLQVSIGDDGSYAAISKVVAPGLPVQLFVNGRLQFAGRFESTHVPSSPHSGGVAKIIARTRLADSHYATAALSTKYLDVTIRQFVLSLFKPQGYVAKDFQFDTNADRNLMTGERIGLPAPVALDPLTEGKAKVQPGETIITCLARHLKRHHLRWWDGATGTINIGKADDTVAPTYRAQDKRGPRSVGNNLLGHERIVDWSEVPSVVNVTGQATNDDDDIVYFRGVSTDPDLTARAKANGHFNRPVTLLIEGNKTKARAQAQADRERALRSKNKDGWKLIFDGWTYWTGTRGIPFVINTTVDVDVEAIGAGGAGRYFIHEVARSLDVRAGLSTHLITVAPGIFYT